MRLRFNAIGCIISVILVWLSTRAFAGLQLIVDTPSSLASENPHDPKFVIALRSNESHYTLDPAALSPDASIMADKYGRRYACSKPSALGELLSLAEDADQSTQHDTSESDFKPDPESGSESEGAEGAASSPGVDEEAQEARDGEVALLQPEGGGAVTPREEAGPWKPPFDLLAPLEATCLYRQEGMWTYEACYNKHIRQFRWVFGGATGCMAAQR